jgi:carbon monoxide dehydrogenase subunit G
LDFDGHCRIPLSPGAAVDALQSAPVLASCLAPHARLTARDGGGFELRRRVVFGGAVLRLNGVLRVDVQQEPLRCLLTVEGNAGNAGFGVVRLLVALQPRGRRGCTLRYQAQVETGGVLVELEPAPVDAALRTAIEVFFARFAERAATRAWRAWQARWSWAVPTLIGAVVAYLGVRGGL